MGSIKHILFVIGISVVLLGGIAWWVDRGNEAPELLLDSDKALQGPLSPEEIKTNNPSITNPMNSIATFTTNKGVIRLELFEDKMPITTGNFIKLANEKFYDGIKFHRVIDGFMIQSGDPNSKGDDVNTYGTGGPGYTIQDEFVQDPLLSNVRGTIAMANTGQPNSGGSQFFINTVDNVGLDFDKEPMASSHPVFGRVIEGVDVVDQISKVETGQNDRPVDPVIIQSIAISKDS
jgi:cyclophilin family peptidyl-prolyl cis-trans isomerase